MEHTEGLRAAAAGASVRCVSVRSALPGTPLVRRTVQDAFIEFAGLTPDLHQPDDLRRLARERNIPVSDLEGTWDDLFEILNVVDRARQSWSGFSGVAGFTSRARSVDPMTRRALRFELYAGGLELANAFDELTDADEQRTRFEQEQADRKALGRPVYPIDEALLTALETMTPTAGIALGVDRLMMLLTGTEDIREVQGW